MRASTYVLTIGFSLAFASSAFAKTSRHPVGDDDQPQAARQQPQTEERTANNSLYAEGLGPGLIYSLNYDRTFGDFAARIGFGYFSLSATAGSSSASVSYLTVPMTVSYLGIGSKKHIFELGAGASILHVGAGASSFGVESSSSSATEVLPVGIIGYRMQPADGGFMLRTGISPVVAGGSVLPWPYIALGGTF
jgi:hypothetical protein